jgi:hypothetical protein
MMTQPPLAKLPATGFGFGFAGAGAAFAVASGFFGFKFSGAPPAAGAAVPPCCPV